jgi:hypothetical protein
VFLLAGRGVYVGSNLYAMTSSRTLIKGFPPSAVEPAAVTHLVLTGNVSKFLLMMIPLSAFPTSACTVPFWPKAGRVYPAPLFYPGEEL